MRVITVVSILLIAYFVSASVQPEFHREKVGEEITDYKKVLSCEPHHPHDTNGKLILKVKGVEVSQGPWSSKEESIRVKEQEMRIEIDQFINKNSDGCEFKNAGTPGPGSDVDYNVISTKLHTVECVDLALGKLASLGYECDGGVLSDCITDAFDVNFYPLSLYRKCDSIFTEKIDNGMCTTPQSDRSKSRSRLNILLDKCEAKWKPNHKIYLEESRKLQEKYGSGSGTAEQYLDEWSKSMGLADEAYCLPGSFKWVVIKDQLKKPITISRGEALESAMENYYLYNTHFDKKPKLEANRKGFVKFGKYLMRAICSLDDWDFMKPKRFTKDCELMKAFIDNCKKKSCNKLKLASYLETGTKIMERIHGVLSGERTL
jgi:hypothetical protein